MGQLTKKQKERQLFFYIETYGCQMNKSDTELISGLLREKGYLPAGKLHESDVVLVNTCSVRDHAEQRVLGRIGILAQWKKVAPHRKLGVIGCMAQRLGGDLIREKPCIDFIVGPDQYRKLPELLGNGFGTGCMATEFHQEETYPNIHPDRNPGISGWVTIARGCNNYCSYCIVPYVRGRERSRPVKDIIQEVEEMSRQGFKEAILLGQNVNSYYDGTRDFADILKDVCNVTGIERIRFLTSHPRDLSDRILKQMASLDKVCHHLHLPLQSGSNRILGLMNRNYTREQYLKIIKKARSLMPDLGLSTDILVGFPGETETEFQETLDLMKQIEFDEAFMYRYSPREGTKAAELKETLTDKEKLKRLDHVIQLQRKITAQKKETMIGKTMAVLPETMSKQSSVEWMGKTGNNHVVVFPCMEKISGHVINVHITSKKGTTLRGYIV